MKVATKQTLEIERIKADKIIGLSSTQVQKRIEQNLVNKTKKKNSKSYFGIVADNLFTFFNLLGLVVVIALIIFKAPITQFFFVIVYLSNIIIGISLEFKSKRCIDKLSLVSESQITVIRNGEKCKISQSDIVLDDIICLELGSQIPVDSIIIDGEIEVNESLLTGESIPVRKKVNDTLLAGSFITSGSCIVRADKVGSEKYIEKLSEKAKKYKKNNSEIMKTLKFLIKTIGFVIVPFATVILLKSTLIYSSLLDKAVLSTATVVIGMIPSGLFLLTSMTLAVGVIKLSKHNTLVQDLYSLETLARVDTICFDKTGTITDGNMSVEEIVNLSNEDTANIISSMLKSLDVNNQTDHALLNKFGKNGNLECVNLIQFSSQKKMSAVTFANGNTYALGAPEFVLSNTEYEKIKNKIETHAKSGYRVLILAKSTSAIKNEEIPCDFLPISLIILSDNIRQESIATIKWFKENGVNVKVISGDNPITVSEISKKVGIDNADKYISLDGLSDEEVIKCANEYTVFGRVSPEQKALLIKALNESGHTTAMTGDGVNDILAMKESKCAITVASGSEAVKNISNLILADNNFTSMPKIVYEGRRVINNVQCTASLYFMKTLFTFITALFLLCYPSSLIYPFKLNQMILLEVFIIGLPSFFLSLQANYNKFNGNFISYMLSKSIPNAILMLCSIGLVYLSKLVLPSEIISEKICEAMCVYTLTFAGLINLFHLCRPLNKFRIILIAICGIIILGIIFYSIFIGLVPFGYYPLTHFKQFVIVFGIFGICVPLSFILNKLFSKLNIKRKIK